MQERLNHCFLERQIRSGEIDLDNYPGTYVIISKPTGHRFLRPVADMLDLIEWLEPRGWELVQVIVGPVPEHSVEGEAGILLRRKPVAT